jgi:hypothetical protein
MAGQPRGLETARQSCGPDLVLTSAVVVAQNRALKYRGFGLGLEPRPVRVARVQTSNFEHAQR